VAQFRFLHAADLHIDSPLVGLSRRSEEFASLVDKASRRAVDNLIQTAIDQLWDGIGLRNVTSLPPPAEVGRRRRSLIGLAVRGPCAQI